MIIGITGSSGAGKSTVCDILEKKYSVKIISADKIAKELSKSGTQYLNEIVQKFGNQILLPNKELNRRKLAEIIYSDKNKRELLNSCTFKYIRKQIELEIKNSNKDVIAIDAPLLFEAKLEDICDLTVAVIAENKNMQIKRIMERDNIDENHAKARIAAQPENEFYISKCDCNILNNNDLEFMEKQIKIVMGKYILEIDRQK